MRALSMMIAAVVAVPLAAQAQAPNAATVPWVATNPNIPHDVISGRATTLKGAEIGTLPANNAAEQPFGPVTSVKIEVLSTCGNNPQVFSLNGQVVGQFNAGNSCTCGPQVQTQVINDAAALAAWDATQLNNNIATFAKAQAGTYAQWASMEVTDAAGHTQTVCIFDRGDNNCQDRANLCQGHTNAAINATGTFGTGPEALEYSGATYSWDFGDGSGSPVLAVNDPRNLAATHTYNGPDGALFTATLTVCSAANDCDSAPYKVAIRQDTLEVETNVAIDEGLWFLYLSAQPNGQIRPAGRYGERISATASAVNAFEVHGHLPTGDGVNNPYVAVVADGLDWVLAQLQPGNTGIQAGANDPDANANGRYLTGGGGQEVYENGMIMDALVASGNPNGVAADGVAAGDTYQDIVQDLADGYAHGQMEAGGDPVRRGSWYYNYNAGNNAQGGHADNSSSQWAAIGMIPAEQQWGVVVPQWVKDENLNALERTYGDNVGGTECGTFGYGNSGSRCLWGCAATTPSGMVQLLLDGKGPGEPAFNGIQAFDKSARWMAENWGAGPNEANSGLVTGYTYGMFAAVKALRLAGVDFLTDNSGGCGGAGQDTQFDWYNDNAKGVARTLVERQNGNGSFRAPNRTDVAGLATQWSLIMLASQLFEQGPVAQCQSDPSVDGTLDLGGNAEFDGTGSFHLDPEGVIVGYEWDFTDGATANGEIVNHSFNAVAIYNVVLTVTDANGLQDTAICPIDVRRNNIPPNAEIARPYEYCEGDTIILDGSGSRDLGEDGGIVSYEWDYTAPVQFDAIDAQGAQVDATNIFVNPGQYAVGLRVTDTDGESAFEFAEFNVLPANDPSCNQPPVARCQDVTIEADAQCGACVDVNNGSSDADGDALTFTATPGCDFALGTTEVTLTVSDGELEDTCTATVTVVDASAPSATCQGDQVECAGPATAVQTSCTGADNCGEPTVTSDAQAAYGPGSHQFACTATDAAGNSTTELCTVEVIDSTAPTAACTGDVQECTGPLTDVMTSCTAEDICAGGAIEASSDAADAYPLGNHTFTCGTTDGAGNSDAIECGVTIADSIPPSIECAAPVTVSAEADHCVGLTATPGATATDICEGDLATTANPDQGEWALGTTGVTHTTADSSGNGASCETSVTVVDDTDPVVDCNAFDIAPNQAPASFTATATDNCSVASITVTAFDCWKINGAGKRKSKLESCEVAFDGDTLTINDVGGVGTNIDWTVVTVDGSGNTTTTQCGITALHPNGGAGGGDNGGCNQGVGNGEEGCDPGNSNQGNPDNTNDEASSDGTGTPGNPGKKGGKKGK